MEHTESPWIAEGPNQDHVTWWVNGRPGMVCRCMNGAGPEDEEANAHLIAAAPDLLAACEKCKEFILAKYGLVAWKQHFSDMEAVIKKAKGE